MPNEAQVEEVKIGMVPLCVGFNKRGIARRE